MWNHSTNVSYIYKNLEIGICNSIIIPTWLLFLVSVMFLPCTEHLQLLGRNAWLKASLNSLLFFFLLFFSSFLYFVSLRRVFTYPILIWLSEGDIHSLLTNSGINIYITSWFTQLQYSRLLYPTDIAVLNNCNSIPFVLRWNYLLATALVSHTLFYSLSFMGTLCWPISTEIFSIAGVSWLVTGNCWLSGRLTFEAIIWSKHLHNILSFKINLIST